MQSGNPQFGYIYGVGLLGSASIYTLLNLMSEQRIDAYRVASVLGYCLLPMVGVGAISVMITLEYVVLPHWTLARLSLIITVVCLGTRCRCFQSSGARMRPLGFLLLFSECLINAFSLRTLSDSCMVVSRCLAFLAVLARESEGHTFYIHYA